MAIAPVIAAPLRGEEASAMESIAELRGIPVVDLETGSILGSVAGLTVDQHTGVIATLVYRAKKGKQRFAVPTAQVAKIGRDVVLLRAQSGQPIDKIEDAPGVSLKELQGCWVTTLEGRHLGTLVDIDFSASDWRVSELELAEGKHLAVEAEALRFGDEILVPSEYLERVKEMPKERYGALGRFFGRDRIDDLRRAMKKTLERKVPPGGTP
jgi:sporulation protein YlmC with PRC-barrel domain